MKSETRIIPKNVVLFGPESTGKTILSQELSKHYKGKRIPEYLRDFCEKKNRLPLLSDMPAIFLGQAENEKTSDLQNQEWQFFDTNLLQLLVYHEFYFGYPAKDEDAFFNPENYSFYLLCYPDLPWENDPLRDMPERRHELYEIFKNELDQRKLPYQIITGKNGDRFQCARQAIAGFFL